MKLAFVFPPMLVGGRPLDFDAIGTSPRGTTGSEIQILSMARELAGMGHECIMFVAQDVRSMPMAWEGVHLAPFETLAKALELTDVDAIMSSLDMNIFRGLTWSPERKRPLRVVFQQLNNFNYRTGDDFADFVDLFVSPAEAHRKHMEHDWPTTRGKWAVVPNGVRVLTHTSLEPYLVGPTPTPGVERVPGRVIYASSPDRGLHLLLQEWPAIKKAVPHATLKIFYFALQRFIDEWKPFDENPQWDVFHKELWRRARYIDMALKALAPHGVEAVGSIGRRQMAFEMAQAEVLAYPCDTVAYTEGFSCAILEGCASGALPIISSMDALGSIYRGICPMVAAPPRKHIDTWRGLVIRALKDREWADEWRERGREFALLHDWHMLAGMVERLILDRIGYEYTIVEPTPTFVAPVVSDEKPPVDFILTFYAGSWLTLDPHHQEDSACGGSRAGCFQLARALARRGYPVCIRATFTQNAVIDGVTYEKIDQPWAATGRVVFAYYDTAALDQAADARLRIASHHSYRPPSYNWASANIHLAPSRHTLTTLQKEYPSGRWELLPNAVADEGIVRTPVSGRVLYHTSPDRGLHYLLEMWPAIKATVPHATLHVVGDAHGYANQGWLRPIQVRLAMARVRNDPSVTFLGNLPRAGVRKELSEAAVFAYPCLPTAPTESFSMSVMESCLVGLPVVLIPADALEEVYRDVVVLSTPDTFVRDVTRTLQEDTTALQAREQAYAARFTYDKMAERLDQIIRGAL